MGSKNEYVTKPIKGTGWALSLVNAEVAIPETWRDAFYDELVSDNVEYRTELENALRQHGVRWI